MSSTIITTKTHTTILRAIAKEIAISEIPTEHIQNVIRQMSEALRATKDGVGIAAPQIGKSLRIFIASEEALFDDEDRPEDRTKKDWKHFIYINPVITNSSKKVQKGPEGCLSVPGIYGEVKRSMKVRVRAYDEHGHVFERGASGLFARLMQHEVDHLNGTLFIDHATHITERAHEH
ncbi:MAG: peptide deformylase [Patescibacteria group bacterium]